MSGHHAVIADAEQSLAAFAAELTAAAYSVALQHSVEYRWLDLQLELWRALTETVEKWAANPPEPLGLLDAQFSARGIRHKEAG
jgi:hypothetical protein